MCSYTFLLPKLTETVTIEAEAMLRETISEDDISVDQYAKAQLLYYVESSDVRGVMHKDGDRVDLYVSTIQKIRERETGSGYSTVSMVLFKVSEDIEDTNDFEIAIKPGVIYKMTDSEQKIRWMLKWISKLSNFYT